MLRARAFERLRHVDRDRVVRRDHRREGCNPEQGDDDYASDQDAWVAAGKPDDRSKVDSKGEVEQIAKQPNGGFRSHALRLVYEIRGSSHA
jgi:hypothetical protein